jgi:hypothetical protein
MKTQLQSKILGVFTLVHLSFLSFSQSVTINPQSTTALIDAKSTTNGTLPTRLTIAQRNLLTLSTGLQVYCTDCSPAGPYIYNGSTWFAMFQTATVSPITYTIGQAAQGGVVFWIDETGQHGLVAATADQNAAAPWYNGNTNTNATRSGVFGGKFNTEKIISGIGSGSYAAILAAEHTGGQYGDWYLPSKNELSIMFTQKNSIGGFVAATYWSSTELDEEPGLIAENANQVNFSTGVVSTVSKNTLNRVRAIRSF